MKEVVTVFAIFSYLNFIVGWRPYRIEKCNVTAHSLSENIEVNATLTETDGISIYVNVKENIKLPFAEIEFYLDSGNGLFDLKVINETVNICRFFRDKKYLPVIQLIYQTYVQLGNFPSSCPIKKNLYFVENMKFDVEKLPPTMPDKRMYLAATLMAKIGSNMKPLSFYKIFSKIVNS